MMDLEKGGREDPVSFGLYQGQAGIPINGLIWMGDRSCMKKQIRDKLDLGFRVLKMKVGASGWKDELEVCSLDPFGI